MHSGTGRRLCTVFLNISESRTLQRPVGHIDFLDPRQLLDRAVGKADSHVNGRPRGVSSP